MKTGTTTATLVAAAVIAFALAGCDNRGDDTERAAPVAPPADGTGTGGTGGTGGGTGGGTSP